MSLMQVVFVWREKVIDEEGINEVSFLNVRLNELK